MEETPRSSSTAVPATGLRIVHARAEGYDVQLQMIDGETRQAWVPRSVVEDARARLATNQDLIVIIGGAPQSACGIQILGMLCGRPPEVEPPFDEVVWSRLPIEDEYDEDMTELPTERYVDASLPLPSDGGSLVRLPQPESPPAAPTRKGLVPIIALGAFALGALSAVVLGGLLAVP